jgi:hypothetical protein
MSPLQFREECLRDVQAFDQPGAQTRVDPDSGEIITAGVGNELFQGVAGVIWSDIHVAMTRSCDKSISPDVLCFCNLAPVDESHS